MVRWTARLVVCLMLDPSGVALGQEPEAPPEAVPSLTGVPRGRGRIHHLWIDIGIANVALGTAIGAVGIPVGIAYQDELSRSGGFHGQVSGEMITASIASSFTISGALYASLSLRHEQRLLQRYTTVHATTGWVGVSLMWLGSSGFVTTTLLGTYGQPGLYGDVPGVLLSVAGLVLVGIESTNLKRVAQDLPPEVREHLYARGHRVALGVSPMLLEGGGGLSLVGAW